MSRNRTLLCPAEEVLHDSGEDYDIITRRRDRRLVFRCTACLFRWSASEAEVRHLSVKAMMRDP